jgi:hypothetical protein
MHQDFWLPRAAERQGPFNIAPGALQHCRRRMKSVANESRDLAGAGQLRTVLLWQGLFGGWLPTSQPSAECEDILAQWHWLNLPLKQSGGVLSRHDTGGNVLLPLTQSSVSNGNGSSSFSSQHRVHPWLQEARAQALELLRRLRNSYHRADPHFKL